MINIGLSCRKKHCEIENRKIENIRESYNITHARKGSESVAKPHLKQERVKYLSYLPTNPDLIV